MAPTPLPRGAWLARGARGLDRVDRVCRMGRAQTERPGLGMPGTRGDGSMARDPTTTSHLIRLRPYSLVSASRTLAVRSY
jgi:hypothetical protein